MKKKSIIPILLAILMSCAKTIEYTESDNITKLTPPKQISIEERTDYDNRTLIKDTKKYDPIANDTSLEKGEYKLSKINPKIYIFEAMPEKKDEINLTTIKIKLRNLEHADQHAFTVYASILHPIIKDNDFLDIKNSVKYLDEFNSNVVLESINKIEENITIAKDIQMKSEGIFNKSYGNSSAIGMKYLDSNSTYDRSLDKVKYLYYEDKYLYFSQRVWNKNYKRNRQLNIISLGNFETSISIESNDPNKNNIFYRTENNFHNMHTHYASSSPTIQKIARSEMIMVKNITNDILKKKYSQHFDNSSFIAIHRNTYNTLDKKYYEVDGYKVPKNEDLHNTKPFLFRSFTVSTPGFVKTLDGDYNFGSSFSAPRVTRLAYELAKKYPFLSYHQIKQIILTTADRNDDGYLNNMFGWGVVNYEKALKGPSQFNAGLIEETFFYQGGRLGLLEKNNKKEYYFVANVYDGSYEWSNDITSGLAGDGNNQDYELITFKGIQGYYKEKNAADIEYTLRIPRVLDSEKNFYSSNATAGLRKLGKGELILSGIQYYSNKTLVDEGTLTLRNNSNSKYLVENGAILNIEGDEIYIANNVLNKGTVDFKSKMTKLVDYVGDDNSTTILNVGSKIHADKFYSTGSLNLRLNSNEDLKEIMKDEVVKIVEAKDIQIDPEAYLYLKFYNNFDNGYLGVSTDQNILLIDTTEAEKRNIPSYDINENKFFESFNNKYRSRFTNARNNSASFNDNMYQIFNIKAGAMGSIATKKQLFTDNYTTYISEVFGVRDIIDNHLSQTQYTTLDKNNSIYTGLLLSTNLNKSDKYDMFKKNVVGNIYGYDRKINAALNLGIFTAIYNAEYKYNTGAVFNSHNYILGLKINTKWNRLHINNEISMNHMPTNVVRSINDEIITSNFNVNLYKYKLNLGFDANIYNTTFTPYIDYNIYLLHFDNFSEVKNTGDKIQLDILGKLIFKQKFNIGLNIDTKINKIVSLTNKIQVGTYDDEKVKLDAKLVGVPFELHGKNIDAYSIEYFTQVNMNFDNKKVNVGLGINNRKEAKITAEFRIDF